MYTIIGIESVEFKPKDSDKIFGTRLHCTFEKENCEGLCVEQVYCPERVDLEGIDLGDIVEISYNRYGKVAKIIKIG